MNEIYFQKVEQIIATNKGMSIEELRKIYSKQFVTERRNKDGEQLLLLRKIESETTGDTQRHEGMYEIYTREGVYVGYVSVDIANTKEADQAEILAYLEEEQRNKGNVTIVLFEVLKDIFIQGTYNGLQIKQQYPKVDLKKVFLEIEKSNYASQAVAGKSGFKKIGDDTTYEMTREEFIKIIQNETQKNINNVKNNHRNEILDENIR